MCAYAAVSFCKSAAHISGCPVLIIRQSIYDNGNTVWPITLIRYIFIIVRGGVPGRFFDSPLNRIIGHVVCFCLGNDVPQLAVVFRIWSSFLDCHYDFSSDDGKYFASLGIIFFLFVLYICKF